MTLKIIAHTLNLLFLCYTLLLMIRVIGSWFPNWHHYSFMRFVAHYTDPYLNLFRRIIPPIISGRDSSRTTSASGTRSASDGAPSRWPACSIRSQR